MTRIGNDTKAPQTKSTAANDAARNATSTTTTTGAEDVPTLDELDAGMSLDRSGGSYESTELQSASGNAGFPPTGDGGMSSLEGMTPIEETPLAKDIAAVEQQCVLEVQGHAHELQTLSSATGGEDGMSLERAADSLMTSSVAAGEAPPGSALPLLEAGVSDAAEHVKTVGDEGLRAKAASVLTATSLGVERTWQLVKDIVRQPRPTPEAGETYEISLQGKLGLAVAGAEGKDVTSITRERNADGSSGDYVVARQVTLGGYLGLKPKAGAEVEVGGVKAAAKAELSATAKEERSIKLEYRSKSLEESHDRLGEIATDKLVVATVGAAATVLSPGVSLIAKLATEAAVSDFKDASAVTLTGELAAEGAAELGALNGKITSKGSAELKLELEEGAIKGGVLTTTGQLEGAVAIAAFGKLGKLGKLGDKVKVGGEYEAGSVSASIAQKAHFSRKAGELSFDRREVEATLTFKIDGQAVKAKLNVPVGENADAVVEALMRGDESAALDRLLDSEVTLTLEHEVRTELGLGAGAAAGAEIGLRGHIAKQSSRVLAENKGRAADVLGKALSSHRGSLSRSDPDLAKQMSAHQQYR